MRGWGWGEEEYGLRVGIGNRVDWGGVKGMEFEILEWIPQWNSQPNIPIYTQSYEI